MVSDINAKVVEIVVERLNVDADTVTAESSFIDDLGADSLDLVELVMEVEEAFDMTIPDKDAEGIRTVGETVAYIKSKVPGGDDDGDDVGEGEGLAGEDIETFETRYDTRGMRILGEYEGKLDSGGEDLSGQDLSGKDLTFANLRRANLKGANLSGANLRSANLMWADLQAAYLEGANFESAQLQNANLAGANLQGAKVRVANLTRADLTDADLRGAVCSSSNFAAANLQGADLRGADFRGSRRGGAKLTGANIEGADFRWSEGFPWDGSILSPRFQKIFQSFRSKTPGKKGKAWWESDSFGCLSLFGLGYGAVALFLLISGVAIGAILGLGAVVFILWVIPGMLFGGSGGGDSKPPGDFDGGGP